MNNKLSLAFSFLFFLLAISTAYSMDLKEEKQEINLFTCKLKDPQDFHINSTCNTLVLKNITKQKFEKIGKNLFDRIFDGKLLKIEYSYPDKAEEFPYVADRFMYDLSLGLLRWGEKIEFLHKKITVQKCGNKEFKYEMFSPPINIWEPFDKKYEIFNLLTEENKTEYERIINIKNKLIVKKKLHTLLEENWRGLCEREEKCVPHVYIGWGDAYVNDVKINKRDIYIDFSAEEFHISNNYFNKEIEKKKNVSAEELFFEINCLISMKNEEYDYIVSKLEFNNIFLDKHVKFMDIILSKLKNENSLEEIDIQASIDLSSNNTYLNNQAQEIIRKIN